MTASTRPEPQRAPTPPDGYDWVSCSPREYGQAGYTLHLIARAERKKENWQTTVCGATASTNGIWRKPPHNTSKARCQACLDGLSPGRHK